MPFDDVPSSLERTFAAGVLAEGYVGCSEVAARGRADEEGVGHVRVITLDGGPAALTADLRTSRLNLLVLRGTVVRAAYF